MTGKAGQGARMAGRYFAHLNELCQTAPNKCTVAAGDFADNYGQSNSPVFRDYVRAYRGTMRAPQGPPIWAYHAYSTGRQLTQNAKETGLERFLSFTGDNRPVWLTEQGGLLKPLEPPPGTPDKNSPPELRIRADDALEKLLDYAIQQPRVKRYYQYAMSGNCGSDDQATAKQYSGNAHDSGLLEPEEGKQLGNGPPCYLPKKPPTQFNYNQFEVRDMYWAFKRRVNP